MAIIASVVLVGNKMGNPIHYSLELPQRCLQLIEELWPAVQRTRQRDRPDLGPLSTTFLVSISMPIINLPIERLERYGKSTLEGYVDDRHKDPKLSAAVEQVLGGHELRRAPFFVQGAWRFTTCTKPPLPNIARGLPDAIASQLSDDKAETKASRNADVAVVRYSANGNGAWWHYVSRCVSSFSTLPAIPREELPQGLRPCLAGIRI